MYTQRKLIVQNDHHHMRCYRTCAHPAVVMSSGPSHLNLTVSSLFTSESCRPIVGNWHTMHTSIIVVLSHNTHDDYFRCIVRFSMYRNGCARVSGSKVKESSQPLDCSARLVLCAHIRIYEKHIHQTTYTQCALKTTSSVELFIRFLTRARTLFNSAASRITSKTHVCWSHDIKVATEST